MTPSLMYEEDVYSPLDHHPKPRPTILIGFHGHAQSGKDTSAKFLVDELGYERISFADPLKELARIVNPVVRWDYYGNTWTLNEIIADLGPEEAKTVGITREFYQDLGKGVRDVLGESTWVDAALAKVKPGGKYVFTDVRFPNEAQALLDHHNGAVIEVRRPGVGPVNGHVSDRRLPEHLISGRVHNDVDIETLRLRVLQVEEEVVARA